MEFQMTKEQLLAEIEDLLRTMPPKETLGEDTDQNLSWLGRAAAVVEQWDAWKTPFFAAHLRALHGPNFVDTGASKELLTMLHQARHALRMQTIGPLSTAFQGGMVFDYFDEVRGVIEEAREDLFFVDAYLDAEFVSRYLPHVASGVIIRLLARERLPSLLPSVDAFARQAGSTIKVRSAPGFHDRYVFVDQKGCYQSGASFKDGAKAAPTILTQITDAFPAVLQTYEALWNQAKVER